MVSCYIIGMVITIQDELGIGKKENNCPSVMCLWDKTFRVQECFVLPAWDKNDDEVLFKTM